MFCNQDEEPKLPEEETPPEGTDLSPEDEEKEV